MKKRYKIGDKVMLVPDSDYQSQSNGEEGEIIDFYYELPEDDSAIYDYVHYYRVKWKNGHNNVYRYTDLMPAEETIKEEKTLKQQAVERFGFISKDDKFTAIHSESDITIKEENPDYWTDFYDSLYLAKSGEGGLCIYDNGKWAERTSLPKNWIVKCSLTIYQPELCEWKKSVNRVGWLTDGWIDNYGDWSDIVAESKGIITYEQFLKWVYNPWKALELSDDSIKPGDWVVGWHHTSGYLHDTPWEIAKVERGYAYPVDHPESNTSIKNVRKQPTIPQALSMEKEWKPKFKIGDRVQVIKSSHGWGDIEYGDIGVVEYVPTRKDDSYSVNFDECKYYWTGTEECFILEESAPKFKIGDKVRVIKQTHGWGGVDKGAIGTVIRKSASFEEEDVYYVDFGEHKATYWKGHESCFELVEESIQGEFVYSPPKLSSIDSGHKLQVGDTPLVRVITINGISSEFKNEQSINLLIHKPKKVKQLKL